MKRNIYSFSHQGTRTHQEDSFYVSGDNKLLTICDGVGGQSNGHIASKTIVGYIAATYELDHSSLDKHNIQQLIWAAQRELHLKVRETPVLEGSSTTIALTYISQNKIIVAHAGDSRVIFISKSKNRIFATSDHSMVQEMRLAEILKTDEEMLSHPLRNRITKCIRGSADSSIRVDLEIATIDHFSKDDILFMGTDGALESFTTKQLVEHFTSGDIDRQWTTFQAHCTQFSQDNNTAILKIL